MEELDFPTMACSAFGSDGPRTGLFFFILFGSFGDYIVLICTYIYIYISFVHLASRFCCLLIFRHQGL